MATTKQVFDALDSDHSGTIPTTNLIEALSSLDIKLSDVQNKEILNQAQKDIGEKLKFYDFEFFVNTANKIKKRESEVACALEIFATDSGDGIKRNGKIDITALTTLGDPMSSDDVDTILKESGISDKQLEEGLIEPHVIMNLIRSIV